MVKEEKSDTCYIVTGAGLVALGQLSAMAGHPEVTICAVPAGILISGKGKEIVERLKKVV
jgi:hypothetical protein